MTIYTVQLSDRLEEVDLDLEGLDPNSPHNDTAIAVKVNGVSKLKFGEYPLFWTLGPKPRWEAVRDKAQEAAISGSHCVSCHQYVWLYPGTKAYAEGHVYSDNGQREFQISHMCEYCFDKVTVTDEADFVLTVEEEPFIPYEEPRDR